MGDASPGRGRGVALSSGLERREGVLLRRLGGPLILQGRRARGDGGEALFGEQSTVGETIGSRTFHSRDRRPRAQGGSTMGQDQDDTVIAPYTTVMRLLKGAIGSKCSWRRHAYARLRRAGAAEEIDDTCGSGTGSRGTDADFMIVPSRRSPRTAEATSRTCPSARVGRLHLAARRRNGIMNIMIRLRDGAHPGDRIRLAIGAKGKDILTQFLIEALTPRWREARSASQLGGGCFAMLAGRRDGRSNLAGRRDVASAFRPPSGVSRLLPARKAAASIRSKRPLRVEGPTPRLRRKAAESARMSTNP